MIEPGSCEPTQIPGFTPVVLGITANYDSNPYIGYKLTRRNPEKPALPNTIFEGHVPFSGCTGNGRPQQGS